MDFVLKICKIIAALAVLVVLGIFAFSVFTFLIGAAAVIALVMWLKGKGLVNSKEDWKYTTTSDIDYSTSPQADMPVTVIEGEAEEVTLASAQR